MRRRWRRARGGSGAGGEGTELNDGEEPIMLRSIDVAVRKRDVVLRNAGRGGDTTDRADRVLHDVS